MWIATQDYEGQSMLINTAHLVRIDIDPFNEHDEPCIRLVYDHAADTLIDNDEAVAFLRTLGFSYNES